MMDKAIADILETRRRKLKEVEDFVNNQLAEPWTDPLIDYVKYLQMNRRGIRANDIPHLIERELKRLFPIPGKAGKG